MDPAIAEIVSAAFYGGKLRTEASREERARTDSAPFKQIAPLPNSPVVVVDFPHVSSTGSGTPMERRRPRWHNPGEVESVVDVLRHIRAPEGSAVAPTLAILSPYAAQVEKLRSRVYGLRNGELSHLEKFAPVRHGLDFVGTVDSFQGSEADIVIVSLVRNNARAGAAALGFLRDRRRMNVLLSRAKHQLILVTSLSFLREAVRGVNPSGGEHDLSFLTTILATIERLAAAEQQLSQFLER